jgi:hypothetical protein
MRRRLSGVVFGVLFCTWVLTAVAGFGVVAVSSLNLINPENGSAANDDDPNGPPAMSSTSAAALVLGVLMIVWPLPFCRKSTSSDATDGFGRDG